jgi:hypothetical protein
LHSTTSAAALLSLDGLPGKISRMRLRDDGKRDFKRFQEAVAVFQCNVVLTALKRG